MYWYNFKLLVICLSKSHFKTDENGAVLEGLFFSTAQNMCWKGLLLRGWFCPTALSITTLFSSKPDIVLALSIHGLQRTWVKSEWSRYKTKMFGRGGGEGEWGHRGPWISYSTHSPSKSYHRSLELIWIKLFWNGSIQAHTTRFWNHIKIFLSKCIIDSYVNFGRGRGADSQAPV